MTTPTIEAQVQDALQVLENLRKGNQEGLNHEHY